MTATFELASAVVNVRPEVILPELSGPTSPAEIWVPFSVNVLVRNDDANPPPPPAPPPPLPPPLPPPPPPPNPPPPAWTLGTVPEMDRSVRASAPPAAATPYSLEIEVTDEELIGPSARLRSTLRLNLVPGAGRAGRAPLPVPPPPRTRKPNGPPELAAGALVTVMSVPTPYRECSTLPCAWATPADAAVTVMTRPIPMARPSEMRITCRIRRRSSRRR